MTKKEIIREFPIQVTSNTMMQRENVVQYEFYNLSNVPVTINGHFLDRYCSGNLNGPPTVIAGSNYYWKPLMKKGEYDDTQYTIAFQDTFYAGVNAQHRLSVIVKEKPE